MTDTKVVENPETLTEEEKEAALKTEEEGEDATEAKEKEAAEAAVKAEEEAKAKEKEEGEEGLTPEEELQTQLAELREKNTSLDSTIRSMEVQVKKYGDVLKEANMLDDIDEEQQKDIDRTEENRRVYLEQLYETMLVNPKYDGMEQLLTTHNKQLVVDAYAEQMVSEDSTIDKATAEVAVVQSINELKNPHKFYFEQISIIDKGGKEEDKEKDEIKKKDAKLTDAPGSVNNMGNAGKGESGWTMKKLDEMDDETMSKAKIPDEILEQWKSGTLPK